jgi:hypothetical protein
LENPAVTLSEMHFGAAVLSELNKSPDPGIPYVMIAGKTSLNRAAVTATADGKSSLFARLVGRLTSPQLLHVVANPFFLGEENDVAVSVTSMRYLPEGRVFGLSVHPVACDHLSYFREPEGLKTLAAVLATGLSPP